MQSIYCTRCGHHTGHSVKYHRRKRRDDHHHCHCGHHHHRDCDCHHHHSHRFICDDSFRLRLGGLQHGLNYRLRQLLGCEVVVHLEDGKRAYGEICHVGSNFVELLVEDKCYHTLETGCGDDDDHMEAKFHKHRRGKKKHSLIFSMDKINSLKHHHDCHCKYS